MGCTKSAVVVDCAGIERTGLCLQGRALQSDVLMKLDDIVLGLLMNTLLKRIVGNG